MNLMIYSINRLEIFLQYLFTHKDILFAVHLMIYFHLLIITDLEGLNNLFLSVFSHFFPPPLTCQIQLQRWLLINETLLIMICIVMKEITLNSRGTFLSLLTYCSRILSTDGS